MPELPLFELGCGGLPDPHVHAGLVARRAGALLHDARLVVVQGDTSSALGGTLGAAQSGIPVAHVEAGLRSHDPLNPWPEEEFRIAIDRESSLLFAPTELNAANLRREGMHGQVHVTGNTGIDALTDLTPGTRARPATLRRRLLVTCHRRESWGEGLEAIASSVITIGRRPGVAISVILHPNPAVATEMRRLLGHAQNVELCEPCGHREMLQRMLDSDLILSDSGGMQEEAPALGTPLLILRERTERPEGIANGNAILAGRDESRIRSLVEWLLDDEGALAAMSRPALPYGDGFSSERIAIVVERWLEQDVSLDEPRLPSSRSATESTEPSPRYASRM